MPCGRFVPQREGGNAALGYEACYPTAPLWQRYSQGAAGQLFEGWLQTHPITAEQPALNSQGVTSFLCRAGYEQQEEQEYSWEFELGQAGLKWVKLTLDCGWGMNESSLAHWEM